MRSTHNENGITCTSCHSVHHSTQEYLLVKRQTPLCFSCHAEQRADFQKPFHHRVEEGLIKCGDCHNPHGTLKAANCGPRPTRTSSASSATATSADRSIYEHEPVKVEGCTACHTPHGSTNPRLLNVARINSLCLQCHTNMGSRTGDPGTRVGSPAE